MAIINSLPRKVALFFFWNIKINLNYDYPNSVTTITSCNSITKNLKILN